MMNPLLNYRFKLKTHPTNVLHYGIPSVNVHILIRFAQLNKMAATAKYILNKILQTTYHLELPIPL